MSRLEKKKLRRITLNLNTAHTLILIRTFHAFSRGNLIQTFSHFTQIYIDESCGENEPPDMNLFKIEVLQCFHKLAKGIFYILSNLDHLWVNSDRNCEQRWFLWVGAECENVQQNKETREEKKPSGRMFYNVLTMLSPFIHVTNVFFYSYRWVLRNRVTTAKWRKRPDFRFDLTV